MYKKILIVFLLILIQSNVVFSDDIYSTSNTLENYQYSIEYNDLSDYDKSDNLINSITIVSFLGFSIFVLAFKNVNKAKNYDRREVVDVMLLGMIFFIIGFLGFISFVLLL